MVNSIFKKSLDLFLPLHDNIDWRRLIF